MSFWHNPAKEKTQLCKYFPNCDRTSIDCWFAHGDHELRCPYYSLNGVCPFNKMCHRIHDRSRANLAPVRIHTSDDIQISDFCVYTTSGVRPFEKRLEYLRPLCNYPMPVEIENHIARCKTEATDKIRRGVLDRICAEFVAPKNGRERLHALLHAEEAHNTSDMRLYDQEYSFTEEPRGREGRNGRYIELIDIKVEGLAEKRPSVLVGDVILAVDLESKAFHRGFVHYVNQDSVSVSFDFSKIRRYKLHKIAFVVSRSQEMLMHRAIDECKYFPSGPSEYTLDLPDRTIDNLNTDQSRAVWAALNTQTNLHMIWGPPGTGKTTTVIKLMQKLMSERPGARVLACTPSNKSAHLLTERMAEALRSRSTEDFGILHVHSLSKLGDGVPEIVLRHSFKEGKRVEGGAFEFPDPKAIRNSSLIVCTLSVAARIFGLFSPANPIEFDYIVVDEAAQATEPQVMQALAMAHEKTQVVLAGDHKQLGPVIRAKCAEPLMDTLFEQCIARFRGPQWQTMLEDNYRSQDSILRIVNVAYADRLNRRATPVISRLPQLVLKHVVGEEYREADSPSIMNMRECHEVMAHLAKLLVDYAIRPQDIVILAPYAKQVKKLKNILHHLLINQFPEETRDRRTSLQALCTRYSHMTYQELPVEICTVEAFQGRESKCVIISTVRSKGSEHDIALDKSRGLGFLCQERRANVALSRAREHMCVIGNAKTLCTDPRWYEYVRRITEHGVVEGGFVLPRPPIAVPLATVVPMDAINEDDKPLVRQE